MCWLVSNLASRGYSNNKMPAPPRSVIPALWTCRLRGSLLPVWTGRAYCAFGAGIAADSPVDAIRGTESSCCLCQSIAASYDAITTPSTPAALQSVSKRTHCGRVCSLAINGNRISWRRWIASSVSEQKKYGRRPLTGLEIYAACVSLVPVSWAIVHSGSATHHSAESIGSCWPR